ncbi:EscU/YscU/HrcU family type III secretion system export apparatus switch protein [Halomonas sp. FeN2]|jgi:flagellar biosynthesis protein|nr:MULTISPECIES: EscU/YscU/HrcU family type III secretion system export apparatus switch protein [Halomonas]TDV89884.1 flagellar biosynthesis protein [Halomonas alkaliantarctica]MBF58986.1 flagellar protein FhlB [Halomonas sp.]MBL1270104.1 EscU/YscU/HrcU family type III secretion system export apparatus switch protein [Halomonas sp.]MBL1270700.1 EscU/YscU/HrcU family type III secretion system export apparatus switch protein [Halomonas sp.]MDN3562451.1 EscU/YscU/HrcU family type III secretion s|tara:strand:+ start:5335 stop:5628 length:294 start_codon:yes stop_codon:yes gene_type:complete
MATPGERRRQAVALAYQDNDRAPKVVAKGYGELAERIMAEAQRQGIYVHDAPELVALLMQLDLDAEIPASLYQIVAELLVWVFELSEEGLTHREMPE